MKLHEIPEGSKIKVECYDAEDKKIGDVITFHHVDGMYSYCTVDGVEENNLVHLSVMTPLKKIGDDLYEIEAEKNPVSETKARKPKKIPVRDASGSTT